MLCSIVQCGEVLCSVQRPVQVGWDQTEELGVAKAKAEVARKVVVPARSPTAPAAR